LRLLVLSGILFVVFAVVLGFASQWWYEKNSTPQSLPAEAPTTSNQTVPTQSPAPGARPLSAGREPREPDSFLLAAAQRIQGDGREAACGSYRLLTDVPGEEAARLCQRIAASLDATFEARFGIAPRGTPQEGIFLFAKREDFRAFAREDGRLRTGYAGYANGARGFVALPWQEDAPQAVATTLAHELTHLVLRRTLGPGLPPWLSEGLADGIGDAANLQGLQEIRGLIGVEGQARRLRDAYRQDRVPSLERLVGLSRANFDQGMRVYDYEQSALFVRYLMASPSRASAFRAYLKRLAKGERYRPEVLPSSLGSTWEKLDSGLRRWLEAEH